MDKWPKLQFVSKGLKSHYLAVIFAIFVGIISIAPQVYALKDQNYKGIQMFGADAEYDYVAKMNKAQYDDYSKGPFPSDPGENYYLAPELGERSMGVGAKMFHIRVIEMNVILKLLCPIALFLILYGWLLEMFSLKSVALIAPLFVMLGINLLDPTELINLASLKTSINTFLPYTRLISPGISSLFLFLGLWGTYRLVNTRLSFRSVIFIGLLSGLSLYSYIYSWTFLVVILGLYFLFFLVKKEKEKIKHFFLVLLVNGIVALPFFINLLKARSDVDYIDTSARIGTIHTHAPILGVWVIIGYFALLFLWPSAYRNMKHFFLFAFTALVVVLNQQIITGFKIQPGHYHWYITKPLIAIVLTFLILYWVEKVMTHMKWKVMIPILLSAVFFLNSVVIQAYSYSVNYQTYQNNQRYDTLFLSLNNNYTPKKNIWAEPNLSTLIMAYTQHNAPDNPYAQYYVDSQDHLRDMLLLGYRLRGVAVKDIANVMNQEKEYITNKIFGIYYRDLPGIHVLPDSELQKLVVAYNKFNVLTLEQNFKDFKIDLIVEDTKDPNLHFDKIPFLSRINIDNGLYIYQFKNR